MTDEKESNWKREYEQRLQDLEKTARMLRTDERRTFPRHDLRLATNALVTGPPQTFRICDISVGGVSFLSSGKFEVGTNLWVTAGNVVAVEIKVVRIALEEGDSNFMEYHYRVHTRFVQEMDGYMAFVLFWDRDKDEGDPIDSTQE